MWGREGWKGNIKRSSGKITYWIYAHSSKSEVVCKGYAWVLVLSCFRKTGEKSWKIGLLPCSNSLFEHWICSGFSVGLKGVILWNTATLQLFWRRDLFAGAVTRSQVPRVQSNKARAGRRESSPSFLSESPAQMFQDEKVEESSRSGLPSLYPPPLQEALSCFTVCTEQEVAESRSVIAVWWHWLPAWAGRG